VDTDVMVAAELFGGVVVGSVGRSDNKDTLPMPAVSQVKTGVLLTVACALDRFESALLATTSLGAEDPPPPQATSAAAPSDDTHSIPARRRDEFIDMTFPLSFLVQARGRQRERVASSEFRIVADAQQSPARLWRVSVFPKTAASTRDSPHRFRTCGGKPHEADRSGVRSTASSAPTHFANGAQRR
jgi:hypothetical protein